MRTFKEYMLSETPNAINYFAKRMGRPPTLAELPSAITAVLQTTTPDNSHDANWVSYCLKTGTLPKVSKAGKALAAGEDPFKYTNLNKKNEI